MYTVECQLIFAGVIVLFMHLSNALSVEMSINKLLSNTQDKLGLVKYFNDLELNQYCDHSILDDDDFKKFEPINPVPCLCMVIYNITIELESSTTINITDVDKAKQQSKINIKNNLKTYNIWKNVANLSSSLKLLMDPLDDLIKWQMICHTGYSISNLSLLCQFLNVEVLLLNNSIPKSSIKNTTVNISGNNLESPSVMFKPEEQNKSDDLKISSNEYSKIISNEGIPNTKTNVANDPISDKEELPEAYNKDIESNITDDLTENDKDVEFTTELKIISSSFNDDSKVDYTILHTDTKETQSILSQKNTFGGSEDTHFLFYFGIMTLLSMLFYLALYNKKKIIALVIEGRRSTNHRRRPNTASYSKVETDDGATVY